MKATGSTTIAVNHRALPAQVSDQTVLTLRGPAQPKVAALLDALSSRPGQTVSRQQLLDEVWDGDPDCDSALTAAVCALRRYLRYNPQESRRVETVRGRGYRLIARTHDPDDFGASTWHDTESILAEATRENPPEASRRSFIADLARRRVFRVLTVYLVIGWATLQVGEVLFEPLGVPPWCLTLLALLIGLGLPVAAVLAWALQVTPNGVVLEIPRSDDLSTHGETSRQRLQSLIIISLICVSAALGFRLMSLESRMARMMHEATIVDTATSNHTQSVSDSDAHRENEAELAVLSQP